MFAIRGDFGVILSSELHKTEFFRSQWYYVGGGTTVRGYSDLSPFAVGDTQLITSLEYRFLFTRTFQTILFVDAGHATSSTRDIFNIKSYKVGKGIGVRLNIPPLGPIRLDFGIDEIGESRIHFNIGHAF